MESLHVGTTCSSRLSLGQDLPALLEGLDSQSLQALHLAVSVRSFLAEKLSEFVGALVAGESKSLRSYTKLSRRPIRSP